MMIKKIFMTVSATMIVVAFFISTFLNGILVLFGLTSPSVETLIDLKNAKQNLENLKKRHKIKNCLFSYIRSNHRSSKSRDNNRRARVLRLL
jgi:ABC-type microcin C transport system permease subunit YejB